MRTRPNIVFILADDLGYGDFSAFNGGLSETTALDGLMREGVCLTQHYAASPVCNPSRACLLTGRYPHRTGSIDTLEWWGLERLALRERTLADMLKGVGYATGLIGKWHLGSFDDRYHPMRRGFDETVCFRGGMHDYWKWRIEWGTQVRRADGRYLTDVWTEEAVGFIERHRNEPFFLHLTFNAPHTPLQVPDEDLQPFLGKSGVPTSGVAKLYGMIRRMDRGVARVLETLRRLGLEENTIVFFCSDNGPQLSGEGEDCITRFNCNFNGSKCSVYEGGIRVPMVLRWPAGLAGGGRSIHEMVHFADWLPTILAMANVPLPAGSLPLDGINVLPVLRGENGQVQTQRCWQWNRYAPLPDCNAAVRDGDWKLIRPWRDRGWCFDTEWLSVSMENPEYFIRNGIFHPPYPAFELGPPQPPLLFNIRDDPGETQNLAEAEPELLNRLGNVLENWFEEVEAERRALPEN